MLVDEAIEATAAGMGERVPSALADDNRGS
jgi:hypothetical protein